MANPYKPASETVSVLGASLRFKGELRGEEDLRILGQVEGSIMLSKYLTVGPEGRVKADIQAHIIAVQGTVEGDLTADTSIAITETGHLTGDIHAPSINISDGADFNGTVFMNTTKRGRSTDKADRHVTPAIASEPVRCTGEG